MWPMPAVGIPALSEYTTRRRPSRHNRSFCCEFFRCHRYKAFSLEELEAMRARMLAVAQAEQGGKGSTRRPNSVRTRRTSSRLAMRQKAG